MKALIKISLLAIVLAVVFISCNKKEEEANFTANFEYEYIDQSTVLYTNTSSGEYYSLTWDFANGEVVTTTDKNQIFQINYPVKGDYNVVLKVMDYGGNSKSASQIINIDTTTLPDMEAIDFLTGGSSKSWFWAADQIGHVGLGPVSDAYGSSEYTWPSWWQIDSWDIDKACMYDAEFVFTKVDNDLTFEQISGSAFVPGPYAETIGIEGDQCYGEDIIPELYGIKNVSLYPSTSNASIEGEYRGTAMLFSDNGAMCWWVGNSEYDIIEITENTLKLRIAQDDNYAWYHTFVSEKPIQ